MTIKEMRNFTGLTQKAFADRFSIPVRTLQDWELGVSRCPEYLRRLIAKDIFDSELDVDGFTFYANGHYITIKEYFNSLCFSFIDNSDDFEEISVKEIESYCDEDSLIATPCFNFEEIEFDSELWGKHEELYYKYREKYIDTLKKYFNL